MVVRDGVATAAPARHTTAKTVRRIMEYLRGIGKAHARTGARSELSFRFQFIRRPSQIRRRRFSATIGKWFWINWLRAKIFISCACDRVFGCRLIEGSGHNLMTPALTLREGDTILDFIGPLGLPSQIRKLDLMARWCWWAAASA